MKSAYVDRQRAHFSRWSRSSTNSGSAICPPAANAQSSSKYSGCEPSGFTIAGLPVNFPAQSFSARLSFQKFSEPLQSTIIMVPHVRQRFVCALGDFAEQKPLEASELERFSLLMVQRRQPLLDH